MFGMFGAKSFWQQLLDELIEKLLSRVAKKSLRLAVHEDDAPFPVHDDHRVRRGFQETAELALGSLTFGDVANRTRHERALFGFERAQADLDRKFRAVFAKAVELEP